MLFIGAEVALILEVADVRYRVLIETIPGGQAEFTVAGIWVDSGYRAAMEKGLRKIDAFSKEYFALLRQHPQLARWLSFSTAMILVVRAGEAVEILPPKPAK